MHAIIKDNSPVIIRGAFKDNTGIQHPRNVLSLWSNSELAAIDVYPVVDEPIPEGMIATDWDLTFDGSQVSRYWVLETAPTAQTVTRRQAKQQLLLAGLLNQVQPAIDAIPDATQRALVQIYWDDSQEFERQHAELIALATALGLDAAGIDALFEAAAQR